MSSNKKNLQLNGEVRHKRFLDQVLTQARKMQWKDWISLFLLAVSFVPGKIWKLKDPHIWVVSEYEHLARDNGYWFFKYVRENHPEQIVYYPISDTAADRPKIDSIGNRVTFSSFKHYMLFWAAEKQFTSSKNAGFPSRICEDLVLWKFHRFQYILLNHGITKGKSTVVDAAKTNFDYICTCSDLDRKIIIEDNGQPPAKVVTVGFARHDNLDNKLLDKKMILVMPTWRSWVNYKIGRNKTEKENIIKEYLRSDYFVKYQELLNSRELIRFLRENDLYMVFYLHDYAQLYSKFFTTQDERVTIAESEKYDIQELLKKAALLITDYSSVCYDFSYMHKPVIYYQFDKEQFEYYQYKAGAHYTYEENGVGMLTYTIEELLSAVKQSYAEQFKMPDEYSRRVDTYFTHHDKENCKRIYDMFSKPAAAH